MLFKRDPESKESKELQPLEVVEEESLEEKPPLPTAEFRNFEAVTRTDLKKATEEFDSKYRKSEETRCLEMQELKELLASELSKARELRRQVEELCADRGIRLS